MFAFLASRRLAALCARDASERHSSDKLQVDRCLCDPCRSPSHRTDYQVELVSVQLRRLVKAVVDMANGQVVLVTTEGLSGGSPMRAVYYVAEEDPTKAQATVQRGHFGTKIERIRRPVVHNHGQPQDRYKCKDRHC